MNKQIILTSIILLLGVMIVSAINPIDNNISGSGIIQIDNNISCQSLTNNNYENITFGIWNDSFRCYPHIIGNQEIGWDLSVFNKENKTCNISIYYNETFNSGVNLSWSIELPYNITIENQSYFENQIYPIINNYSEDSYYEGHFAYNIISCEDSILSQINDSQEITPPVEPFISGGGSSKCYTNWTCSNGTAVKINPRCYTNTDKPSCNSQETKQGGINSIGEVNNSVIREDSVKPDKTPDKNIKSEKEDYKMILWIGLIILIILGYLAIKKLIVKEKTE